MFVSLAIGNVEKMQINDNNISSDMCYILGVPYRQNYVQALLYS
jgi:hypothetical protein